MKVYLTDPHCGDIEYLGRAATFIRYNSTLTGWTPKLLNECWLLEVAAWPLDPNGQYITTAEQAYWAALAWVNKTDEAGVVEAHAVSSPQYRGRWLSKDTIQQLDYIITHTGCSRMIAQITSPLAARIWKRFGFTIGEEFAYKDINYGLSEEAGRHALGRPAGTTGNQNSEGT